MSSARWIPGPDVCAALLAGAFSAMACAGCEEQRRPWEGQQGPSPVLSAVPPARTAAALGVEGGGGKGDEGEGGGGKGAAEPEVPKVPVRVGGPWVTCYGQFRLSGEPLKDVTRLSILCGPENGMRRLLKEAMQGSVAEGGAPVTLGIKLVRGECYRVFAVGDGGVSDLDVSVKSSRGAMIASDGGDDGWPIVQPDRPFCALEDDNATVEVSARKGGGRFAAEVWVLRPRKR